jgi:DNA-binding NtrC family response regulator
MDTTRTILLGNSVPTDALRREIELAARSDAKVLILGETGSGKEVVARSIHEQSARRARPFIAVNCSGIPETLLESELFGHTRGSFTGAYRDKPGVIRQAHRGTLFLDELGEMSLRMQAILLRWAETGEIHTVGADAATPPTDVRLITATNRDLCAQIAAGAFREDLYYRLNVIQISVAPLRRRRDDVPVLLDHFLRTTSQSQSMPQPALTADAKIALRDYAWPGNVRELRNMAERMVAAGLGRPIAPADLPAEIRPVNSRSGCVPHQPADIDTAATSTVEATAAISMVEPLPDVTKLLSRFEQGEDFWTVVHRPFKARELTRQQLKALIDAGLRMTNGSYRALLPVFNLPATDYKRLHAFLYQQQCNLPVNGYRQRHTRRFQLHVDHADSASAVA